MVVDLQTFDTVFLHQFLYHRRYNLFVYLVNTERHSRCTAVLCHPLVRDEVIAYARTLTQRKRLVALNGVGVIEFLIADTLDLLCLQQRRIMVIWRLENLIKQTVGRVHDLIRTRELEHRDRLNGSCHGLHQVLQHVLKLLRFVAQRVFEFIQLLELSDIVVVLIGVEDRQHDGVLGQLRSGELVDVFQTLAVIGYQRQRNGRSVQIVHAVRDGAQRAVQLAEIVVLVDLLHRERVLVGLYRFGFLRSLYDRRFGVQLLDRLDRVAEQLVLTTHLQRHL